MSTVLIISCSLSLISPIFYVLAIVRGKARPHRTTRLVILLSSFLAAISLFAQGDHVSFWLAAVATLQSLLIFSLSFKHGIGGWGKLDIWCLFIAFGGILLWQILSEPFYALYSAILADFTGMIPTLVKTYRYPQTESATFFAIDTVAAFLTIVAVQNWTFVQIAFPGYLVFINFAIVVLIYRKNVMRFSKRG